MCANGTQTTDAPAYPLRDLGQAQQVALQQVNEAFAQNSIAIVLSVGDLQDWSLQYLWDDAQNSAYPAYCFVAPYDMVFCVPALADEYRQDAPAALQPLIAQFAQK